MSYLLTNPNANRSHEFLIEHFGKALLATNERVLRRSMMFEEFADAQTASHRGWSTIVADRRRFVDEQTNYINNLTAAGHTKDSPQLVAAVHEREIRKEQLARATGEAKATLAVSNRVQDVRNTGRDYLNQRARSAQKSLDFVSVKLPKGDERGIVLAEREKQRGYKAEAAEVSKAIPTKAQHEAEVTESIAVLRRKGEEAMHVRFHRGRAEIVEPAKAINAEPSNINEIATAPDVFPLLVSLFPDVFLARAIAAVEEHHLNTPGLKLSTADKAAKLKKLADDLLASERIECAALFALLERGEEVDFRHSTDVRALLGIAGPVPRE